MKRNNLKSHIFQQCLDLLRSDDLETAKRLLNGLRLSAAELGAIALANEIRTRLEQKRLSVFRGPAAGFVEPKDSFSVTQNEIEFKLRTMVVVTPVRNAVAYIDETISSVVTQRGNFKLRYHVQDAGSTDGTVEILRQWEERLRDGNPLGGAQVEFTWRSEPDSGMYDGINRGFKYICDDFDDALADTSIMTWINADDIFAARALWTAHSFFIEHPEFNWITGLGALMNEAGSVVNISAEPAAYSQKNLASGIHDGRYLPFVQQEGTFWRYSLWRRVGGLNADTFRLAGDWDLWRRFAAETPLTLLQTVLAIHRRHTGQLSENITGYYAEIDSAPKIPLSYSGLRQFGFRSVFDMNAGRWNAIEVPFTDIVNVTPPAGVPESTIMLPDTLPDGRPWPKISVITPSFNQGRYIAETIESVIQQGYPNVEHIIIDGGSTDETMEVVDCYRHHLAYVVSERDKGQSDALNKGFRRASGDILCWLNSDDQFAPGALFAVAMAFGTHEVDMVSGICEVYEDGRLVHRHMSSCEDGPLPLADLLDLDNAWNAGQFFYQPEVFFSRALWEKAGAHVREDCYYSMDYELWCRFAYAGAKLHVIGAPLARFRMHPEQKTADPSKFKTELVTVRDRFAEARSIDVPASTRPSVRWDRKLRVAMVNDIGLRYGAGIAQGRLAAGIDMAGHDVQIFELASCLDANGDVDEAGLIDDVVQFAPDIVVFGNLHAANRESVSLIAALSERYPSYWVTHDFWLFTGRCAYPGKCQKYLTGCDASCPTPNQYPDLAPQKIADAWHRKHDLLKGEYSPVILGNSTWSAKMAERALTVDGSAAKSKVARIKLGAPAHLFRPRSRSVARQDLGINPDHFVIAFSVSSLSDERKGGGLLLEALHDLGLNDLSVLLIGNLDKPLDIKGVHVVSLGYVTDPATIVAALNSANIYVGPSIEETFGQVFIEAALVGIPSIGFNQTGIVDAIVDGVTGLRVDCSAQALREGILRLYNNRGFCDSLGYWAHVYAANEFSLESSYRTLLNVWRASGLVDQLQLPHKIGFVRQSEYVDESLGTVAKWRGEKGVSTPEGPYLPDFPTTFRWCHGAETIIRFNCGSEGRHRVRLIYYCPLFDSLRITAHVNDSPDSEIFLHRTAFGRTDGVDILINARSGWNTLKLVPGSSREPTNEEPRALTFMLVDVEILEADRKTEDKICFG